MKHVTIIFSTLFWFMFFLTKAQPNLVPNPSFETYTTCPSGLENAEYTGNWYDPTDGTCDYFDTCYQATIPPQSLPPSSPTNFMGYQNAFNGGGGYIGIMCYAELPPENLLYREYIQTYLNSPLVAGQKYFLSFYISLADSSRFSCDAIGAHISNTPITLAGIPPVSYANLNVVPQVQSSPSQLLTDAINWKKISGAFIAAGGEQYITIGNFNNNSNTKIARRISSQIPFNGGQTAYYYVDEVCLSLSPQTCNVDPSVGIQAYNVIRPNFYYDPKSERIILENKLLTCTINVMDLFGGIVKTAILNDSKGFLDVSDLSPGCYFVSIADDKINFVKKIIIY